MSGLYDMADYWIYREFVGAGPRACPGGTTGIAGIYRADTEVSPYGGARSMLVIA